MKQGWNYIHIDTSEVMMMSGWKLYVYGRTLEDSTKLIPLIQPISKRYNLTTKVATEYIIIRNTNKSIVWSSVVIYLTPKIFQSFDKLINNLNDKLIKYERPQFGTMHGARPFKDHIIYSRYDLITPINPFIGIKYDEYATLYRGEHGTSYNIERNVDPIPTSYYSGL
jgi:hypothetical protein